ncbi:MAG: hypothetical protein JWO32_307 [Bacteroidetes bacterium]|nr:hypothetical protein [Bacteroidota bacterium]
MKPEREFDKIIKQKIDESEGAFPFDENNWQKASKLMDAERGAVSRYSNKRFLLLGALAFLLGSVGFFSYKLLNPPVTGITVIKEDVPTQKLADQLTGVHSSGIAKGESKISLSANENKAGSINNSDKTQVAKNDEIENSSNTTVILSEQVNKDHSSLSSSNKKFNHVTGAKGVKNNSGNTNQITSTLNSGKSEVNSGAAFSSDNTENNTVTAGSNMYENLFLNTRVSVLPKHPIDDEIKTTAYDFIRIYDEDYYKSKRRKTFYLDAEAGLAYMAGWTAPHGKDADGFNGYAGLNFGFHIKNKISASVGAQVYNISHIRQPFYTGSNLNYDFGSNGTYTTVVTNSLLYFAIPLKINYALNKRNIIGAGINAGFLFNGNNTVETYNISDAVKSNILKTRTTGYYEGTNTINIMLSAFYSRAVTRRIKLNAELQYGISDTYKNTETNRLQEKNMGIRLGLQYTLFDK